MTYDLLKLAEECALFFNTNRSESAKRTMRAVAAALREAHAEIEKAHAIFGPDTTIEMLEDGLEARAELPKLRAELETANALIKRHEDALEWMSQEQHSIHSYSYDCGNSYGVYSNGDRRYISEAKSTPLAAIESAMKEKP